MKISSSLSIRVSAIALLVSVCSPSRAACTSTNTTVTEITPLSFGKFIPGATGGTVVINAATGARTASGVVLLAGTGNSAGENGEYQITHGTSNGTFTVSVSTPKSLTKSGAPSMSSSLVVSASSSSITSSGTFVNGQATVWLGGTLSVAGNQPNGTYNSATSGSSRITVSVGSCST